MVMEQQMFQAICLTYVLEEIWCLSVSLGGGANTVEATNNSKMIEIKYAPSLGNINKLHYRLFGVA